MPQSRLCHNIYTGIFPIPSWSPLKGLTLGKHTTEWLKTNLKRAIRTRYFFREKSLKDLKTQHNLIKTRIDRIYDDKLDGVIDNSTYFVKREQYLKEQSFVLEQINKETYDR